MKYYLLAILSFFLLTSCYTEERKKISNNLSQAAELLHTINNESPYQLMNQGNFGWLCEIGGWPQNLQSAKYMYANGSYNDAITAESYIDKAVLIASKIGDKELQTELQNLSSVINYIKQYAFGAKENYFNDRYESYIDEMIKSDRDAIQKIEDCRKIMN